MITLTLIRLFSQVRRIRQRSVLTYCLQANQHLTPMEIVQPVTYAARMYFRDPRASARFPRGLIPLPLTLPLPLY